MTPPALHEFLAAAAGVAGALIGLLFVAISVAPERLSADDADQAHRVRASAALTAFTNALTVSLFGLIPGVGLGGPAFVVGLLGVFFVAGSLLSLTRFGRVPRTAMRDAFYLVGLLVVFGLQVWGGLRLLVHQHDPSAAEEIAILVSVCFFIGIARAWELIGGPDIGLGVELRERVRERRTADGEDRGDE